MRRIQVLASKKGARLFRNNVALGWVGRPEKITTKKTVTVYPGDVVVRVARPLHAGLCKGSSDLIGWRPIIITPEMIGRTIAQFTACETKYMDGVVSLEQSAFIKVVNDAGGCAFAPRSEDDIKPYLG